MTYVPYPDTDLAALFARVERLSGADRETDLAITNAFARHRDGWKYRWGAQALEPGSQEIAVLDLPEDEDFEEHYMSINDLDVIVPRRYTAQLAPVIELVEKVLPGWRICMEFTDGIAEDVYLIGPGYDDSKPGANSSLPIAGKPIALALLMAMLDGLGRAKPS